MFKARKNKLTNAAFTSFATKLSLMRVLYRDIKIGCCVASIISSKQKDNSVNNVHQNK